LTAPIRSMPELVDAIRARRDELNISHETIDQISGMPTGYTSKLLADGDRSKTAGKGRSQLRGFGYTSLGAVLGALGIGLAVVDDPAARAQVESRWQKRKRPQRLLPASASRLSIEQEIQITADLSAQVEISERMKMLGKLGGKASAKRRMKTMGKRARQRIATHAARARWSKRK
jgi:hypothetical protein